ncbi:phage holin family protein [Moraxella sp. ZY210820]|uniref:phage holin family protein n=1 Tax=unclassified Moraxella TaxID=2685852 RepID=UPI0027300136|nr:phage holin family protein [Moraxella sp. ZY210820]WLF83812.1 phage holin family protein [Moraxella sp. ZY210820]
MDEKDPTTYTAITYVWVFLLAMSGGLVAFIRRLNKSKEELPLTMIFCKLGGELIVSGFAGVVTFYLCEYWNFAPLLTAVCVAISGHLGGASIDKIVQIFETLMKKP